MNEYVKNLNRIEFVVTMACTGRCKHCSEGEHISCTGHIDAKDYFNNCGLLRLDLRSDYEKQDIIEKFPFRKKHTAYITRNENAAY